MTGFLLGLAAGAAGALAPVLLRRRRTGSGEERGVGVFGRPGMSPRQAQDLVRAHPRTCHCHGTGVVDPTASPARPCPVVWRPRVHVVPDRVGWVPRAGTR